MLVNHFLERSSELFPEKVALICYDERKSYSELENAANSLANALIDRGLMRNDRVAIYLENSIESVISIFGILKAGGIFVIINPQVKAKKMKYILSDCQIKVLISDVEQLKENSNVLVNCPDLQSVFITDDHEDTQLIQHVQNRLDTFSFMDAIDRYSTKPPVIRNIDIDLASIIYTSGSTGNPKGVMLTHQNMVSAANSIIEYLENRNDDIIINCLPLSFDYGLYQILMATKFGGTVVLEKGFLYPYRLIDLIIKERVTGFPLVPTIAAIILQLKTLKNYNFDNLRYITNTAQALAPKYITQLQDVFPKSKIYSMYGLTECKRVSYLDPEELSKRPNSVGKAMPNTETFIVSENGDNIVEPGEVGELVVRGANIMKGYWNLPEETENKLRPGPYPGEKVLYTGDLFKMDEEGFLYFIGRKDNIIKSAGEMVSPKEVENVLYELYDITEVAVIGVPDEILGQAITAVISLRKNSKLTVNDIIFHCTKHLEKYMIPKTIEIRTDLPKTSSGKINKKDLH